VIGCYSNNTELWFVNINHVTFEGDSHFNMIWGNQKVSNERATWISLYILYFFRKKAGLQGFIKKFITPEPSEINNYFFFTEFPKIWPIFCAISDIFFTLRKKCRKLIFFKCKLSFLTLDINAKFHFKATFVNIMYAYFQPFWRNFNFSNKIFFFIKQLFYLNFHSKIALQ
jgi:hypothetical protein